MITELEDEGLFADALHYLKEYKAKEMFYNQSVDHTVQMINEIEDRVTVYLAEMNKNDPLTWDELQKMEGKPVWIEADNGQEKFQHWFIIDEFTLSDIPGLQIMWCLQQSFRFWEQDLGVTWQAYRKERNENA